MRRYFKSVFRAYNKRSLSKRKTEIVDSWYKQQVSEMEAAPDEEEVKEQVWTKVAQATATKQKRRFKFEPQAYAAAAVILVFFVGLAYFFLKDNNSRPEYIAAPATHKAVAYINDLGVEKEIYNQEHVTDLSAENEKQEVVLKTPKGTSFDLILPDGTKVFLNSDSEITYPKKFDSKARRVFVEGEVYFEVAHNSAQPFIVETRLVDIEVLGTKFNVRSYSDSQENAISLFEGSVRLIKSQAEELMVPGELVLINNQLSPFKKKRFGESDPLAWKKGIFNFVDCPFSEISRELSRWYDVDFDLSELQHDVEFTVTLDRRLTLDKLLSIFSSTKEVDFQVENQIIKVTNYISK